MSTSLVVPAGGRRDFFLRAAAFSAPLLALPFQMRSQDSDPAPAPLSPSVLSAAELSVKQLRAEARARHMTARSIRRVHTSLGILFGHMDETGHTAHMQRVLKAKGLIDNPLDYQQLALLRDRYTAKTGDAVSDAEFQALVDNNATMWPKFHALMQGGGVRAVRAQILRGLENGADRIERDERNGLARLGRAHLRLVDNYGGGNPDVPFDPTGWDICAAIGVAGVYLGTWAVMDAIAAVSAFAFGPLAWALIGLFLAVTGVVCM